MNEATYNPNQARVSTGVAGTGVQAAVQVPQSNQIVCAIMERLGGLSVHAERLESLADRIVGLPPAEPKSEGVRAPTPQPVHLSGRLDVAIEAIDHIEGRIRLALIRLERFA